MVDVITLCLGGVDCFLSLGLGNLIHERLGRRDHVGEIIANGVGLGGRFGGLRIRFDKRLRFLGRSDPLLPCDVRCSYATYVGRFSRISICGKINVLHRRTIPPSTPVWVVDSVAATAVILTF